MKKEWIEFYEKEYFIKTGGDLVSDILKLRNKSLAPPSLEEIEAIICLLFDCELGSFRKRGVRGQAKQWFYYIAYKYHTSPEVAKYIGVGDSSTVRKSIMSVVNFKDARLIERKILRELNGEI